MLVPKISRLYDHRATFSKFSVSNTNFQKIQKFRFFSGDSEKTVGVIKETMSEVSSRARNLRENLLVKFRKFEKLVEI